ncbi:predicted protein [Naegleria gruberi]|uniref:Small nuclear ribonucleoprotein Sm D3 n=1 Tax=Naegleria gruberi TaxID=5762 RepID=D2VN92_NAEGR|nr:uncharacterized protein NAEGRDRAFT_70413 [Naegleria gruberi]EFC41611.1 predicted protein [Naegleria gruberi]|eukprot:XP_002674355.1 predicted protein [Naegleria gruberi strain NEG-M]
MSSNIGIPIKLLHEAESHIISLETKSGELYRGKLIEAEDSMNVQLVDVTVTHRNGQQSAMNTVYIRGSKIRYFVLPDILQKAPMFKVVDSTVKGQGRGYGSQTKVHRGSGLGLGYGVGRGRVTARGGGRGGSSK